MTKETAIEAANILYSIEYVSDIIDRVNIINRECEDGEVTAILLRCCQELEELCKERNNKLELL